VADANADSVKKRAFDKKNKAEYTQLKRKPEQFSDSERLRILRETGDILHLHAISDEASSRDLQEELSVRRRELTEAEKLFEPSGAALRLHRRNLEKALRDNASHWEITRGGDAEALKLVTEALENCRKDVPSYPQGDQESLDFYQELADQAAGIKKRSEPEPPLTGEYLRLALDFQDKLSRSHIDGNAPAEKDFDVFLKCDLTKHFRTFWHNSPRVECDLFFKLPTQTGLGYPHYYAWLTVYHGNRVALSGAADLIAEGKTKFEVDDFLNKSEIARNPDCLKKVFPDPLIPMILKRAGARGGNDFSQLPGDEQKG